MHKTMFRNLSLLTAISFLWGVASAVAMQDVDILQDGYELTESFSSDLGHDEEASYVITNYSPQGFNIVYSSSRGTKSNRYVDAGDRLNSNTYMLGFASKMKPELPGVTSLGFSVAVLEQLRQSGQANVSVMYNANRDTIPGTLSVVAPVTKMPVIIDNQVMKMEAIHVRGNFQDGSRQGTADFFINSNRKNPMMLEYRVKFSWENAPRTLRITRIVAGPSRASDMEQTLRTMRRMAVYGIHFDFGKAKIKKDTRSLVANIATTLKNNPGWTLEIQGHTDSIGSPEFNQELSEKRARAVADSLISNYGIDPSRLTSVGYGQSKPTATNKTIRGRAQNRRVELVRTDR